MSTGVGNSLKGTGYKAVNTLSPAKNDIFKMLMGGDFPGGDQLKSLAGGGNEQTWSQLEAPALRQFQQLQGDISSRFSGAGARRSSGFQNTLSAAGGDLSEKLQANRLGLQQNATQQLMQIYQMLLGTEDQALIPKKKKWWEELLPAATQGIAQGATQFGLSFI